MSGKNQPGQNKVSLCDKHSSSHYSLQSSVNVGGFESLCVLRLGKKKKNPAHFVTCTHFIDDVSVLSHQ